jgi:hypothetical protein
MLGYTENDVIKMMACVSLSLHYIPPNKSNDELREGLQQAYSFLDGILAEGRV